MNEQPSWQAANRELDGFAYSVSHDLRAPLRAISGFAQIIGRRFAGDLPQQGRHYFDNVVEASERMERLIEDLLRYARLGQRGVELAPLRSGRASAGCRRPWVTGSASPVP